MAFKNEDLIHLFLTLRVRKNNRLEWLYPRLYRNEK